MMYYLTENQTEQRRLSGYPYPYIARSGSIYIRTRFRDYPNHIWLPLYEDMQKDSGSFQCGAMWATAYGNMTYEFWNGHACWHKTGSSDGYIRLASSLFVCAYNSGNWTLAMRGDGGGRAAFVMCSTNSYSSAKNMACSPSRFAQTDSTRWQDSSLDGTMHHTVYRCADYRLSVFIDGSKVYETVVETPNMDTVAANHGIYVGMLPSSWSYNGTAQGEWYTGGLSDVMGVPFALSDEQVLRLAGRDSCIEPKRGDPVLICGSGEDVILLPVRKTDDFEISTRVENRVGISGQGYDVYQGTPFWYIPNVFCSPVKSLMSGGESTFLDLASRLGMQGNPVFTEHQGMRCLYLNGSSHIRKYWPSSESDTEYFYGGYRKAIMLWVNAMYGGSGYLVSFGTSSRHFALSINESGIVTGECSSASVTSDISCAGDWHLLCLRYDGLTESGSAGANELSLYIDGVKVASKTASIDTEFNANWCVGSAAWSDGNYRPKAYVAQVHYLTARDTTEWKDLESDMQAAVRAVRSLKEVRLAYDLQVAIIGSVFLPVRNPFLRELFYRQALQRGLVFHAPLTDSLTYTTTGHTLSLSSSSRLTEGTVIDGMKCAQLSSGNDTYTGYLYADNVKGLPKGREPGTYCLWIFFGCEPGEQNTGWIGFLFAPLGGSSSGTIRCLGYDGENGHPRIGFYNYDANSTQTIYKRWVHFTMVYDGTNALIYINGELDSQFDKSVLNTGEYGRILIGNSDGDSVRAQTAVTDVRVYNRVLAAEEIRAVYNLRKPVERPEGLLFWQHPEYVRHSVVYSGQPMRYAGTWLSSSYNGVSYSEFDGSSMQYTKAKAEYSLANLQNAITFGGWLYVSELTGSDQCVLGDAQAGGFCFYVTGNQGDAAFGLRTLLKTQNNSGYTTIISTTNKGAGVWTHVAVTYDGAVFSVYVDCVLAGQQDLDGVITYGTNSTSFGMGANADGSAGSYVESFRGRLADVRVYSRALSQAEIKQWYMFAPWFETPAQLEKGLVFWLPLDKYQEQAETGQTITYRNTIPVVDSAAGVPAVKFSGYSTGLSCPAGGLPSGGSDRSLSVWIYMTGTGDYPYFLGYSGGNNATNFCLGIFGGGQSLGARLGFDWNSGATLSMNAWNHYCGVYAGGTFTAYLNGTAVGSTAADCDTGTSLLSMAYNAGQGDSANGFTGYMRDARVYDRALIPSEITALSRQSLLPELPEEDWELVLDLPLTAQSSTAATGQAVHEYGTVSYTTIGNRECVSLNGSSGLYVAASGLPYENQGWKAEISFYCSSLSESQLFNWGSSMDLYGVRFHLYQHPSYSGYRLFVDNINNPGRGVHSGSLSTGTWYQFTAVYVSGVLYLLDGSGNIISMSKLAFAILQSANAYIGYRMNPDAPGFFTGALSNIKVYAQGGV